MSILNTLTGGGGNIPEFAWIEYESHNIQTPDYSQALTSYGSGSTTVLATDGSHSSSGIDYVFLYSNASKSGNCLTVSSQCYSWSVGSPPTFIPGSLKTPGWCAPNPNQSCAQELYYVTKITDYDNGFPDIISIEYSKRIYFATKTVLQINKSNVIKIHLTEQSGDQFKKVSLVN